MARGAGFGLGETSCASAIVAINVTAMQTDEMTGFFMPFVTLTPNTAC
jgi:hypothetical protein